MTLERLILEKLNDAHPRMLTEKTLLSDCQLDDSRVTLTDMRSALKRLQLKEGGAQVTGTRTDDATKFKITADGIARLSE